MDVWIGDDGYVHKLRFEQKLAAGSSMTMEEELYDWGTDVNVTVPSDDEVVDLTQLLGTELGEARGRRSQDLEVRPRLGRARL